MKNELTSPLEMTHEALNDRTEEIRARAHQLCEERGRGDGREIDDWLQAE